MVQIEVDFMFVHEVAVIGTEKLYFHNVRIDLETLNLVTRWSYFDKNFNLKILFFLYWLFYLVLKFLIEELVQQHWANALIYYPEVIN